MPILVAKVLVLYKTTQNHQFLLLTRSLQANAYPGIEDLPGGKALDNKPLAQAAARETYEETGLKIKNLHLLTTYEWEHNFVKRQESLFYTLVEKQDVKIDPLEHSSYRWIDISDLDSSTLHPQLKLIISTYLYQKAFL